MSIPPSALAWQRSPAWCQGRAVAGLRAGIMGVQGGQLGGYSRCQLSGGGQLVWTLAAVLPPGCRYVSDEWCIRSLRLSTKQVATVS